MSNILYLPELENALRFWEDTNLIAEATFQLGLGQYEPFATDFKPLIGTEIDQRSFLRRSVKNYMSLRVGLENGIEITDDQFLPRVPSMSRGVYSPVEIMRGLTHRNISFFPYFLTRWMKTKKVFQLSDSEIITPHPIVEGNYLDHLPYETFIVKFTDPMKILWNAGYKGFSSAGSNEKLLMVVSNPPFIEIFSIPSTIEKPLLKDDLRMFFQKHLRSHSQIKRVFKKMEEHSDLVHDTYFFNVVAEFSPGKLNFWGHPYGQDMHVKEGNCPLCEAPQFLFNWLNGLCKLLAEQQPEIRKVVQGSENAIAENSADYSWNNVPIGQVMDIDRSGEDGKTVIVCTKGTELSPHHRRGHTRRYYNDDGTIKFSVWIEPTFVRKDKLETENIKGSATVLKKE